MFIVGLQKNAHCSLKTRHHTVACLFFQVYFNVTVGLRSCPDDGEDEDITVTVRPVGYNESTTVRIHSHCRCSCGPTRRCRESSRSPCRGPGEETGQEQRPDHGFTNDSIRDSNWNCRADGSDVDCSGRGVCECGRCVCEQSRLGTIYGEYCEVDDFSCPYKGGLLCGGKSEKTTGTRFHAHFTSLISFPPVSVCSSQDGERVCQASVCVRTAGPVMTAVVPSQQRPAGQPTARSAAGGAGVCAASVCATAPNTLDTSARDVPPAKAAANHTGTCHFSVCYKKYWEVFAPLITDVVVFCFVPQEVCGLPSVSWSHTTRGGALQQHLFPIGGVHG